MLSPYQWQVSSHLTRAKKAGTPATLTLKEWVATVKYFDNKCAYCRTRPTEVLEHFLPIILGGGTTANNCIPACESCNSKKGSSHPDRLSRLDFSVENIEYIKRYLLGEVNVNPPHTVNSRALVVYGT